ncbi:multiple sugar transport system substrate-binding protein [Cohnella sp. SGD-V74]|uniref:ABC transporter substrate-binding protein n=1 Tax=unclassified Cohnella TaxID=2636738 RepID=UPI000D4619FD|nr:MULTISPECIES: extracellular solute-binding protein [unclassified Cohnella]PRX64590.1 multiple sugar transport system substrate-binding protein [Cohnella sp. SGD-V74]
MRRVTLLIVGFAMLLTMAACSGSGSNGSVGRNDIAIPDGGTGTESVRNEDKQPDRSAGVSPGETEKNKGGKKTIVLATGGSSDYFKEAKKKYEDRHPDITIQLKDYRGEGKLDESEYDKIVTKMNTELLSGKGAADLIVLDFLPVGKYVNKKMLVDLSEMMEQDSSFQKEQYYSNIWDNSKLNGGLYSMPLHFYMDFFWVDEEAVSKTGVNIDDKTWTFDQFIDTTKELIKKGSYPHGLLGISKTGALELLFQDNYAAFVDEAGRKANFDSDLFVRLLEQVNTLFDEQVMTENYEGLQGYFDFRASIRSIEDYFTYPVMFHGTGKLYQKPIAEGQQTGTYFTTGYNVGIYSNSAVKKEAWDFIKFLLSDEMQGSKNRQDQNRSYLMFPMNKATLEGQLKELLKEGTVKFEDMDGKVKTVNITEAGLSIFKQRIAAANKPLHQTPSQISEILFEEAKAFFNKQKSAEDAAKLIQSRVGIYLNE